MSIAPEGLLLVDKPTGVTSHDVVDLVRKALGQPRVGHAGTLDPFASGLLPLVLGRATRLVRFLPHSPKRYQGVLRLGVATSTDDLTGEVLRREASPPPPRAQVLAAAARLRGTLRQVPPAFSAKKVGGQRMYRLARQGRPASAPPATVEVSRFELEQEPDGDWRFLAEVSAGTYIRALARDLGEQLGCGGTLVCLRRVAIGPLHVDSAVPVVDVAADRLRERLRGAVVPLEAMPLGLPSLPLPDPSAARRFASGLAVPGPWGPPFEGLRRVFAPDEKLLGIGEVTAAGVRPVVVLPELGSPDESPAPHSAAARKRRGPSPDRDS